MQLARRQLFTQLASLSAIGLLSACNSAYATELQTVTNLQQLAQQAAAQKVPMLLFVTAPHCRYCHQLERDVIQPILKNQQYQHKVLMRRLDLAEDMLVDFDGQRKDSMLVAKRYRAQLTPTMVFLAPDGNLIEENILGVVADIDQYGGMIDARLNRALTALGNSAQIQHH